MQELVQSFKKAEGELLTTEEQFGQPHKIKHGMHQEYYATGQLMREGMIIDGKRNGTWAVFEKDGSKIDEFTYKSGVLVDENGKAIEGYIDRTLTGTTNEML